MKLSAEERELLDNAFVRQSSLRLKAFANGKYKYEVAGEMLAGLTLSDICELYADGNSFVAGGKLDVIDAVKVLWRGCDYSKRENDSYKFTRRLMKRYLDSELIELAGNYIDDMFLDSGEFYDEYTTQKNDDNKKKAPPPKYTMASLVVDQIARIYHWSPDVILSMPLPQVWQFYHLARQTENPKYSWRQLTDHVNIVIRRRQRERKNTK